jgi:hypothetical protein
VGGERVALVRHPQERRAPPVAGTAAGGSVGGVGVAGWLGQRTAVVAAQLDATLHRRGDRVVGGLEAEDEHGRLGPGVDQRLSGIEQPAVRRLEPGLGEGAHRPDTVVVVREGD